jgi:hypothetical protein
MTRAKRSFGQLVLHVLSSFGLVCVCLLCLFFLTIFGTLHQIDHGLYDAKQKFFNSWFLWTELGGVNLPVFPGGVLTMSVLAMNLLVGGILRIHWRSRSAGVIIIHFGITFLLIAGLVKMTRAVEGHLTLWEEDRLSTTTRENRSDHFTSYTLWEIAIWELDATERRTVADGTELIIPNEHLVDLDEGARRTFSSSELPFDLTLQGFIRNCDVLPKGPRWEATGEVIDGYGIRELPPEKESERDIAGMHAEVSENGLVQRGILYGAQRLPWVIEVAGRTFAIDMRHTRYPMPYEIRLEKFIKEDHPGISMAKAYRSEVTRIDQRGEERVLIQMNEPLREGGLVLFQSSWGPQTADSDGPFFSVFSVVNNPSDKWPEYSLWVITLGLVFAFGRTLLRFLRKQREEARGLTQNES